MLCASVLVQLGYNRIEITKGDIVLGSKCWVKEENLFLLV